MKKIIQHQIDLYQPNFIKHGPVPEGMFCNNMTTQNERYRQLLNPLLNCKNSNFSICDLGSGLCHLHEYLIENNVIHNYTGIEIVSEMNDFVQNKFDNISILNVDFLDVNFKDNFDFIVLSGTLNLKGNISNEEWEHYVFEVIKKMFALSNYAISFYLLTSYSTFSKDELFYISPERIIDFIQNNLSRFYQISTSYPLYEFTVTVIKKDVIQANYVHNDFKKYF